MRAMRFLLLSLGLVGLLIACRQEEGPVEIVRGSGYVVTGERSLTAFTAVSLQGVGKLEIDEAGSESVSITTDDNFLPYIETRVQGGKLVISIQDNAVFNNVTELVYRVTVKTLDNLELDGAGEVEVLHLDGEECAIHLDGGGNIVVSGKVTRQEVVINGLAFYHADDLACEGATVEENGAGMAVVQVGNKLDVTIEGVGSVEYIGDPMITQTLNGLGTVKRH